MTDKLALRREARERLHALPPADRARAGSRIAAAVWRVPEVRSATRVLLYASIAEEVPTDSIAQEAKRRGIALVYPRCLPDSTEMTLHRVSDVEDLEPGGRYGIREPARSCPEVDPAEIDVVFLPGLGWDRRGFRLGRGAGYYDRLLATPGWRGERCGLFFAAQEFTEIPDDPWDVPLDVVVTEREVVAFGAAREKAP